MDLNWYSSMKKKIEKGSNDFWHRKLTLKPKFWHFLTPPLYTNSQNSIVSFPYVDSWIKWQNIELFLNNSLHGYVNIFNLISQFYLRWNWVSTGPSAFLNFLTSNGKIFGRCSYIMSQPLPWWDSHGLAISPEWVPWCWSFTIVPIFS